MHNISNYLFVTINHYLLIIITIIIIPIGSMYAIYGNIYHQYTPNVSIYTIHGSYGI
jgi:ABC-type phosphate transport system permease subunit